MTFLSEADALDALARTRARLIADGYRVGVELAEKYGAVTGQMIVQEMQTRGLLQPGDHQLSQHWVANIFKGKEYKKTWARLGHVRVGNDARNVHAAPRMAWVLRDAPRKLPEAHDLCPLCQRAASKDLQQQIARLQRQILELRAENEQLTRTPPPIIL